MNLPIKLVDLVTLLFLSLLVVIIIFIILQRNIKRFKLRNIKDPHFLACKSIPKELKDAIRRKHDKSHVYSEPPNLITTTYQDNPNDKTKLFLIRMKVFDVAKNLEYALNEFGIKRPSSIKFEDFIQKIIESNNSKIPNNMLKELNGLYKWAMLDPMPFSGDHLKRVYRLINQIIDHLSSNPNNKNNERIQQFKLDLNENGDYDFNKIYMMKSSKSNFNYNIMESSSYTNLNINNNNNANLNSEINSIKSKQVKFDDINDSNTKFKQPSKNILFNRNNNCIDQKSSSSSKETDLDKEKLLNDSSNDTSFDSTTASSSKNLTKNNKKSTKMTKSSSSLSSSNNLSSDDASNQNQWSQLNDDSIKIFDSENEQLPLVLNLNTNAKKSSHNKKKSNHSDITIVPTVVSTTPSGGFVTTKLNTKNKSHSSLVVASLTPTNDIQMTTIAGKSNCAAENEAFNKTFDNNL